MLCAPDSCAGGRRSSLRSPRACTSLGGLRSTTRSTGFGFGIGFATGCGVGSATAARGCARGGTGWGGVSVFSTGGGSGGVASGTGKAGSASATGSGTFISGTVSLGGVSFGAAAGALGGGARSTSTAGNASPLSTMRLRLARRNATPAACSPSTSAKHAPQRAASPRRAVAGRPDSASALISARYRPVRRARS